MGQSPAAVEAENPALLRLSQIGIDDDDPLVGLGQREAKVGDCGRFPFPGQRARDRDGLDFPRRRRDKKGRPDRSIAFRLDRLRLRAGISSMTGSAIAA